MWQGIANSVFKQTIDDDIVENKGIFDKSIIQCSFKKRLAKTNQRKFVASSGCELFQQTLTNNGLCYSFNALKSSNIWRPSKVIEAFERNLNRQQQKSLQNYAGAGTNEGKQVLI